MKIETVSGERLFDALPALAQLRITVFEDYPYLYRDSLEYERKYLATFASAKDAIVVTATDDSGLIVGCSTGSALAGGHEEFSKPLAEADYTLADMFYFSESVLLPDARGQGVGHAFFDDRERHARALGYKRAVFCAVERPEDHPLKPADYRPLDAFWLKRGYEKLQGVECRFEWQDIDRDAPDAKAMAYWMRAL